MRLVVNWKRIAARSHSMWAFYASLICLIAPDLIYVLAERDTDPRMWWWAALILLVYGIIGRLKDQGIARVLALLTILGSGTMPTTVHAATPMPAPDAVFTEKAVPFIGRWEGLRLQAYRDIVGVWTVCYGETKGVRPGDSYTKAECDAMLAREVLSYRRGLHRYLSDEARAARLPVARDVAFVSLAYNAGVRAIGRSTATRRLNAGNIAGACTALTWWNKAGGRVIRGLVRRRTDERALCMRGV